MLKMSLLKKTLLVCCGLIILLVIVTAYKIHTSLEHMNIDTNNTILQNEENNNMEQREQMQQDALQPEKPEDFYTMIIGLDYRDDHFSLNTDSLIVAHIIPQTNSIKLVSLPRDLKVENLRQQSVKVNSVFSEGYMHALNEGRKNPNLLSGKKVSMGHVKVPEEYISSGMVVLRETVENFLDIDIEYTFVVNFQTVISLVDEVGGIEIDVDRSMHYDDESDGTHIHLEEGVQVLNGIDALNFARFREDNRGVDYYSNDFERGLRQQKVIMALAHELSSWSNLTNLFQLLDIVSVNLKTDMNRDVMISLIKKFHGHLNGESIISIPFEGVWKSPFVQITEENLEKLKHDFTSTERL